MRPGGERPTSTAPFPHTGGGLVARCQGSGAYTAAAIAAIAFGRPATVVDGNVERVVARFFTVETLRCRQVKAGAPPPRPRPLTPTTAEGRPGDYAQAMMDLGATVCLPKRNPKCMTLSAAGGSLFRARARGLAAELPRRLPKAERVRPAARVAFWTLVDPEGAHSAAAEAGERACSAA